MILMTCLSKVRSTFSTIGLLIIGLTVFGSQYTYAQDQTDSLWMLEWHTEWDDSLFEWEIIYETNNEEEYNEEGDFDATWIQSTSQWDYSVGDYYGTIWRKWPDRDDQWELKSEDNTTTIKMKWLNDVSEWTINYNNQIKVTWISKSFNDGNTWLLSKSEYGEFEFYTEFVDDPRDWLIYDATSPDLPFDVKMACCFISMYITTKQFMR